ncbi:predicted protein [Histoplasma capsulatum var. duboisii H88]|uniref:Predicted protein n=1 Tax=Ajellomyces capsulatus (strain H88) TaxID=544711 RepID=F0U655_AJEC8|nr:predicted protein [Histoplasma capsulatum var. duboisii H88]
MPVDRAGYQNVHFHNASASACIGENGSITEDNLLWILNNELLIVEEGQSWTIQHRSLGPNYCTFKQSVLGEDSAHADGNAGGRTVTASSSQNGMFPATLVAPRVVRKYFLLEGLDWVIRVALVVVELFCPN